MLKRVGMVSCLVVTASDRVAGTTRLVESACVVADLRPRRSMARQSFFRCSPGPQADLESRATVPETVIADVRSGGVSCEKWQGFPLALTPSPEQMGEVEDEA